MESKSEAHVTSGKELMVVLSRYLTDHSSRKLNFLYWNMVDQKDTALCFVNLTGKDLNRINNPELIFRAIRIRKAADWAIIKNFMDNYIVSQDDRKAVYVVRVDYLMTYLKELDYNPADILLKRNTFGTGYAVSKIQDDGHRTEITAADLHRDDLQVGKPICTLDNDIQSLYLIDKLYTKYRKLLYSDASDLNITDITKAYLDNPDFKFKIDDSSVILPVKDGLDVVARKFILSVTKSGEPCKLEQIYLKHGMTTVVSRFSNQLMTIVSSRAYLQCFLSTKAKRGNKS